MSLNSPSSTPRMAALSSLTVKTRRWGTGSNSNPNCCTWLRPFCASGVGADKGGALQSPLGSLQNPARRQRDELIAGRIQLRHQSIHCLGGIFGRVVCQVFPDRITVQLAPRLLHPPGEALGGTEHVLRNRD